MLHHSARLLKSTIFEVVVGELRGVSAEQTVDPLEAEGLVLESYLYQWETD